MKNWNDSTIDWKDPKIIDEWEFGYDGICSDCRCKRGNPHLEGCDIERCKNCGHQLLICECSIKLKKRSPLK